MRWMALVLGLSACATSATTNDTTELDDTKPENQTGQVDQEGSEDAEEKDTTEGDCPDSWILTYEIDGEVNITDTPMDMGNADAVVGGTEADRIQLRFMDDNGAPMMESAYLTDFNLVQDFSVVVDLLGAFTINSDLVSNASDTCGVASGEVRGTTLVWDTCDYGAHHGTAEWTPNQGASGPGCISSYHVEGNVECIDESWVAGCSDGLLEEGDNPQDYVYNQPMLDFTFSSSDLESFEMTNAQFGVELPAYSTNRTWLSLYGTLISKELVPTPACLCE